MNSNTAYRILGVEKNASLTDIESARRKLLQALHPDKHAPAQKEVFERMTRDIVEAAAFLSKSARGKKNRRGRPPGTILEDILFDVRGPGSNSEGLVKYEKRYASDSVLAVAVLSIDYKFSWATTSIFGGQKQDHSGCALNVVVLNRTEKAIDNLYLGQQCFLIDDRGHQYSPSDPSFCWNTNADRSFNRHSDFIVPNSKVEGFVVFPSLRSESERFLRWFLKGNFQIDGEYYKGNYDIQLA